MAINKIDQPDPTTPVVFADYTQQNEIAKGNSVGLAPRDFILGDLASTTSTVVIAQGTYIYQAGQVYETQTSDESITGTISAGMNWIALAVSGTTLTASWVTSFSGYTYNEQYQGWYSGTTQIIPMGIWLDGSTYNRFKAADSRNPYVGILGDGRMLLDDKRIVSTASQVKIKGIDTQGEDINTTAGNIDSGGGNIDSNGGNIDSGGGDLLVGGEVSLTNYTDGSFSVSTSTSGTTAFPFGVYAGVNITLSVTGGASGYVAVERLVGSTWRELARESLVSPTTLIRIPTIIAHTGRTRIRNSFIAGSVSSATCYYSKV